MTILMLIKMAIIYSITEHLHNQLTVGGPLRPNLWLQLSEPTRLQFITWVNHIWNQLVTRQGGLTWHSLSPCRPDQMGLTRIIRADIRRTRSHMTQQRTAWLNHILQLHRAAMRPSLLNVKPSNVPGATKCLVCCRTTGTILKYALTASDSHVFSLDDQSLSIMYWWIQKLTFRDWLLIFVF